jgi:hypothetical protein
MVLRESYETISHTLFFQNAKLSQCQNNVLHVAFDLYCVVQGIVL